MKFFDGLYNFEIVLLVGGSLLFLVALVGVIVAIIRGKSFVPLVILFVISVPMIGYPSVEAIEYKDGVLSIKKKVHELENDPNNQVLRASLQQDIAKVQERPSNQPETDATLAKAHFVLGNDDVAKAKLDAALQKDPHLPEAQDLKNKVQLSDRLQALTSQVEATPTDSAAKQQLEQTVSEVSRAKVANPQTLDTARKARMILASPAATLQPSAGPRAGVADRLRMESVRVTPNHH